MTIDARDVALRQRLVRRFGDGVIPWLDELPSALVAIAARWDVTFEALIPRGSMSVVIRCRTLDHPDAVFKMCPDTARIGLEAAALSAWTTSHSPTVFAWDPGVGAVLMEAITPGTTLADSEQPPALVQLAELLMAFRDQARPDAELPPLRRRVSYLFDAWERELARAPQLAEVIPSHLPARGRDLALRLAEAVGHTSLLHGDLNPGNILDGGQARGLVAIDPAPCLGDPAFDAIDTVFTQAAAASDITTYAEVLAAAIDVDAARLMDWCIAFAGMTASERVQEGFASPEAVTPLVELALQGSGT